MNKKILGIRIGTAVTVIMCAVAAIAFWILAKYNSTLSGEVTASAISSAIEGII